MNSYCDPGSASMEGQDPLLAETAPGILPVLEHCHVRRGACPSVWTDASRLHRCDLAAILAANGSLPGCDPGLCHRVPFPFRLDGVQGISTQTSVDKRASFSQTPRLLDKASRHYASIHTFCDVDGVADLH